MAINAVDKMKIEQYLKGNAVGYMSYTDMCDYLGKRGKISDSEFLEYFTERVMNEFRKNDKLAVKHVVKLIVVAEAFVEWMHDAETEISEEILDKIRSFKEFYEEYLNRNCFDRDDDIMAELDSITALLAKFYPQDETNESVSRYLTQIVELQEETKKMRNELNEISRLYGNLQLSVSQKDTKIENMMKQNMTLCNDIQRKDSEINRLNKTIERLNDRIRELEILLREADFTISNLETCQAQLEVLKEETQRLRKLFEEESKAKEAATIYANRCFQIESLIYKKLLLDGANVDELVSYIQKSGLATSNSEVADLLKKVGQKINIESSSFSFAPNYNIVPPVLAKDRNFTVNIPLGCKHYDIMLVSDFHVQEVNQSTLTTLDTLYNYCANKDIHLILNLGDLYDARGLRELSYEHAVKKYKLVEDSIIKFPKANGIYQAILGGNHECNIASYGFDPISMLVGERSDFINLGATHASISLSNLKCILGVFDIHHPHTFDFSVKIDEDDGVDMECVIKYLEDIYQSQGRNRDDSYIDIFGHMHLTRLNYLGSYYHLPNFSKGISHLRIYFDEDTNIKYMIIMPLSFVNKFQFSKNGEFVYQKVKAKK